MVAFCSAAKIEKLDWQVGGGRWRGMKDEEVEMLGSTRRSKKHRTHPIVYWWWWWFWRTGRRRKRARINKNQFRLVETPGSLRSAPGYVKWWTYVYSNHLQKWKFQVFYIKRSSLDPNLEGFTFRPALSRNPIQSSTVYGCSMLLSLFPLFFRAAVAAVVLSLCRRKPGFQLLCKYMAIFVRCFLCEWRGGFLFEAA